MVEYILLLVVVVGMFAVFLPNVSKGFDTVTTAIGGKFEVQLRTGRAPATLWQK